LPYADDKLLSKNVYVNYEIWKKEWVNSDHNFYIKNLHIKESNNDLHPLNFARWNYYCKWMGE
jgi:hypothetical protein